MEVDIKFQMYLYGKPWDVLNKKECEDRKDEITIYTNPKVFKNVPLSALEGYFVVLSNEGVDINTGIVESFRRFTPRYSFQRENMSKLEEKFNGRFIPFDK